MTFRLVRFLPRHLFGLRLQKSQAAFREALTKPEYGAALAMAGPCFTAMVDDKVIACGGVQVFHEHRAEAWALLGRDCGPHMRAITRAAIGWFEQAPYRRIEINVATDFAAGHRWATMLGFRAEGPEKLAFGPDGRGAIPYVRLT